MIEIEKIVNGLRKHEIKQLRHLVWNLINEWKKMVDKWATTFSAVAIKSPDFVIHFILDEDGPSSSLLDGAVLLTTQPTTL